MATAKQLDQQGEEAKKLYESIASSAKNYNERRKERTEELKSILTPIWAALADGKTVNGCKNKVEWARWVNPTAKHPERYFYMVMNDKKALKSLQPDHRPCSAGIGILRGSPTGASVEVQVLGNGVKGGFSVSVEPREVPIKEDMKCPACLWGTPVENGKYKRHSDLTGHAGKDWCKLSGKPVRENLAASAVVRALYHKTKRALSSMRLWSDDVKSLFDEAAAPISEKESKTLKARVDAHMDEERARAAKLREAANAKAAAA